MGRNGRNSSHTLYSSPTPSKKTITFVLAFRIGIGLILLGSLFLGGCVKSSGLSWQKAKSLGVKGIPLLERAVLDNSTLKVTDVLETAQVAAIAHQDSQTLWLIDYNVEELCGAMGCLYSMYWEKDGFTRVFSAYLQPPPAQIPLFRLVQSPSPADLPCLSVQQPDRVNNLYQSFLYCYNGKIYQLSEKIAIKL